jgi:4'-phosphopantetheinyl transferase
MQLHWPMTTATVDLAADEVHVWAVPLDEAAAAMRDLEATLTDDERARAARFKLDKPRWQFVVSRGALRTILGHHLAVAPQDVPLIYANNGKPELKAGEWHFNLTHSGELALVAVTVGCAVGVDVERIRPVRRRDELAHRYFAPAEIDAILSLDESQRTDAFLRCWTRKEALLKTIGAGLAYPLDAVTVPVGDEAGLWIDLPAHGSFVAARCWLDDATPSADYLGAVATLGKQREPVCRSYRV